MAAKRLEIFKIYDGRGCNFVATEVEVYVDLGSGHRRKSEAIARDCFQKLLDEAENDCAIEWHCMGDHHVMVDGKLFQLEVHYDVKEVT
jgi:hypothetical protein